MSRLSVIIATMERDRELCRCLESIWAQSRLPEELVIVDDGNLDAELLRAKLPQGIEFQYHHKSPPGLSASRNLGAKVARGSLLLFLDDDVVLEPNFIEEILRVFQEDTTGRLGGVSGVIANRMPRPRWFKAWSRVFFLDRGKPGELFPWGFFSEIGIPERVVEVSWVPGGLSCFRKEVFQELALSDMNQIGRHGLADIEFSWRVSQRYRLKVTPYARLSHFPKGRDPKNALERGRRQLLNHGRIFRTHGSPAPSNWIRFLWAAFGLVSGNLGAALLSRNGQERKWRILLGLGNFLGAIEFLNTIRTPEDPP